MPWLPCCSWGLPKWFRSYCRHRLVPFGSDQIKTSPPQWGLFIFSTHLVPISKDAFTAFKCGFVLQLSACLVCWLHSVCLAAISILLLSHDHYTEWLHTNDPHNNCTSWGIFEVNSLILHGACTHAHMKLVLMKLKVVFFFSKKVKALWWQ